MNRIFSSIPLASLFIVLMTIGCSSDPDDPVLIWDIQGDVNLRMIEKIDDRGSSVDFEVNTQDRSFCEDALILNRINVDVQQIDLSIIGVEQGDGCPDPGFSAECTLDLPELTEKNYSVEVKLPRQASVNGILRITDEAYVLDMESNEGIFIPNKTLYKTPETIVFGRYTDNTENQSAFNDFLDIMLLYDPYLEGTRVPLLYEGVYQNFIISISPAPVFDVTLTPLDPRIVGENGYRGFFGGTQEQLIMIINDWRDRWIGSDVQLHLMDAAGNYY